MKLNKYFVRILLNGFFSFPSDITLFSGDDHAKSVHTSPEFLKSRVGFLWLKKSSTGGSRLNEFQRQFFLPKRPFQSGFFLIKKKFNRGDHIDNSSVVLLILVVVSTW